MKYTIRTVYTILSILLGVTVFVVGPKKSVFAQYDTGGCSFLAGTRVTMKEGDVPIEKMRVGDVVRSFDPKSELLEDGVVEAVHRRENPDYYRLVFSDGIVLSATGRHPLFLGNSYRSPHPDTLTGKPQADGFEAVQFLAPGDVVYRNGEVALVTTTLTSLQKVVTPVNVYNLTVSGNETYFAQGIAVHNKSSCSILPPGTTSTPAPTSGTQAPAPYLGYCTVNCPPAPCDCGVGGVGGTCPGGCGGHQLCPAGPGECATFSSGGVTVGSCESATCWAADQGCCNPAAPTPTLAPTTTTTVGPTVAPTGPVAPPPADTPEPAPPADPVTGCDPSVWGPWTSCSGPLQTAFCTGTIRARAVKVNKTDTSCAAVLASTTYLDGTIFFDTPSSAQQLIPTTQASGAYVSWSNVLGGTYTLADIYAANYVPARACWSRSLNAPTSGEGYTTTLSVPTDNETLTWDVGYTLGAPWVQTGGANVFAAGNVISLVPNGITPRVFNLDGTGGYPGVVTYSGSGYDFDVGPTQGSTTVSSKNWLASDSRPIVNYYELLWRRFGGGTTPDSFPDLTAVAKPASRTTPYYVAGDMTTSGDWVVGDGETVIFIVSGNLTLGGKVTLTGSGFAAFIVSGNITVSPSVGGLYTSSTPVIEGIYVTSPTGTLKTGTSSVPGAERLVAQGIFVAGSFLLERDLESINQNTTTSSELFLYNPRLLFTMPDSMKDVPITWEEVAP
ncbi:hypothetical protein HY087_01845 [Candidatus Gottesmanbacteria bacterium]|nr:hypothetical protein [Candidatus Gottesmanbacteria bacterium]